MTMGWPLGVHLKLVFNSPIFGSDCRFGSPVVGETSKRTGDVPTGYAWGETTKKRDGHGDGHQPQPSH